MSQFGGKDSKRHFTVVMGGKEHGLYVSSTPSSAAKKAVTKLCAANKNKKVEFSIREITQGSKKKTYGPYSGYIEKLKEPIELKGRVIKHKPVAKLSGKSGAKKGGYPFSSLGNPNFTSEQKQKQEEYLSRFPLAFQKIIIDGRAPNDPKNEQMVHMSSTPITNKKELYDYLSNQGSNLNHWLRALDIEKSEGSLLSKLNKIIIKLNEYDQSNTPSNSKLLKSIEEDRQRYPSFYQ
jgi:hypothetical protein